MERKELEIMMDNFTKKISDHINSYNSEDEKNLNSLKEDITFFINDVEELKDNAVSYYKNCDEIGFSANTIEYEGYIRAINDVIENLQSSGLNRICDIEKANLKD